MTCDYCKDYFNSLVELHIQSFIYNLCPGCYHNKIEIIEACWRTQTRRSATMVFLCKECGICVSSDQIRCSSCEVWSPEIYMDEKRLLSLTPDQFYQIRNHVIHEDHKHYCDVNGKAYTKYLAWGNYKCDIRSVRLSGQTMGRKVRSIVSATLRMIVKRFTGRIG